MKRYLIGGALLAVGLAACAAPQPQLRSDVVTVTRSAFNAAQGADLFGTVEPTDLPPGTVTPFPSQTPLPTSLPEAEEDWERRTPGIERREIIVREPRTNTPVRLHIVRIDPTLMDLKVHYQPGGANSISGWQVETEALVVVNGGFFTHDFYTEGTTFVDGEEFGVTTGYEDKIGVGGFFATTDGEVTIIPLGKQAEPPGTYTFDYATQAYPMLLMPGAVAAYNEDTGHAAERTVVGLDKEGRVYFIAIRTGIFTLFGLSQMLGELVEQDELELEVALNLDGGKSSGMEVYAGQEHTHWNAQSSLPIIIAVYPKEGVFVEPLTFRAPRLR